MVIDAEILTLEVAKTLKNGDILYHRSLLDSKGKHRRYKVIGKAKTWRTRPNDVTISLKRGMREFVKINQNDLSDFMY